MPRIGTSNLSQRPWPRICGELTPNTAWRSIYLLRAFPAVAFQSAEYAQFSVGGRDARLERANEHAVADSVGGDDCEVLRGQFRGSGRGARHRGYERAHALARHAHARVHDAQRGEAGWNLARRPSMGALACSS